MYGFPSLASAAHQPSSEHEVPDYEPPRPGAPRPQERAEPLPPSAPDPTLPAWLRPAYTADDVPDFHPPGESAYGASRGPSFDQQPPGPAGPAAGPAGSGPGPGLGPGSGSGGPPGQRKRRRWVIPVVGGAAALLILSGAATVLLYVRANDSVDTTAGPVVSVAASTAETGAQSAPSAGDGTSRGPAAAGPNGAASPSAPGAGVTCTYSPADRGGGEPRLVATPAPRATLTGKPNATLETNLGAIGIQLYADRAPCTVNSFVHLSRDDFYSDTPCHRLTTEGLWVLQCGDPGGTGTGTPGYQFGEENLPTALPPYPRGTLAMANAGPGTNGSQFFIVYKDSAIPPDYSVFGQVTSGLDLLDRIAAAGTTMGGADGAPKLAVKITEIRVS
ncbi:peptidylprolyl isomerase [Dactylosporangium sp. NPDC049742]|uniref:peptidylprolyl isomerase n=1 Tax=Dactylosporangium sp. NPDC049742 TaxID=3154737 RepID=UPI003432F098